ncbi:MAG: hypothetical protein JSU03_01395 [Bacteroidetes bacterium]|nr:hypothetical protein [Bacteroidota bacterium]MBS1755909.1 hypothetical protein [Bacteroidota bacterium]
MKLLSKPMLLLLFCLSSAAVFSQKIDTRQKLFASLPETMKVSDASLIKAFSFFPGQKVSIALSNSLVFNGEVISNEVKYSNLQNIIIRSQQLNNALLSISKMINADKSITYTGRIISNNAFDGYVIKRNIAGQYNMQKVETGKIFQDCSY